MKKKFTDKQFKILDVAEELIARKGFDGASVREICAKANINVAMISYYFGSKEKMMTYLYQYRVQKTREHFAEFSETIKDGRPEMQMKEIIKFIVSQIFKYYHFHGFVVQEVRHSDYVKEELLQFYEICVKRIDDVTKKGVASGVFTYAPKPEDVLTNILGAALFTIRNKDFLERFLPTKSNTEYFVEAEMKAKANILLSVFSLLGYTTD